MLEEALKVLLLQDLFLLLKSLAKKRRYNVNHGVISTLTGGRIPLVEAANDAERRLIGGDVDL